MGSPLLTNQDLTPVLYKGCICNAELPREILNILIYNDANQESMKKNLATKYWRTQFAY